MSEACFYAALRLKLVTDGLQIRAARLPAGGVRVVSGGAQIGGEFVRMPPAVAAFLEEAVRVTPRLAQIAERLRTESQDVDGAKVRAGDETSRPAATERLQPSTVSTTRVP